MGDPAPHLQRIQSQSIDAVRAHSLAAIVGVEQVFELVPECGQQIGVSSFARIQYQRRDRWRVRFIIVTWLPSRATRGARLVAVHCW